MNILITVDYQGDFANPEGKLYVPDAEKIQQQIQNNINNEMFDIRIVSFDTHDVSEYQNSPESNMFPIHCEFGSDGWKLFNVKMPTQKRFDNFIEEVANVFSFFETEDDVYFTKNKFDIWAGNEDFQDWVFKNLNKDRDNIYIQGVATNYCVFMNAMGFVERGFKVFILKDAVKAIKDNTSESSVITLKNSGVNFIDSPLNMSETEIWDLEVKGLVDKAEIFFKIENIDSVIRILKSEISNYIEENKLQSLVIGISGGLDSAVVAALCKDIGIPVIGVSIPINSSADHREKAHWVGKTYCDYFEENTCWNELSKDISKALQGSNTFVEMAGFNNFSNAISQGNMKARLRMMTLYDIARKTNGMVMSTDNLSEYNMGFWTLHGDVGDYGLIQNLNKGFEIPQIAKALGIREDIISQPPSDGLMVTEENTDEAQLGASYKEIDAILEFGRNMNNPKIKKIIDRYKSMAFKRNGVINVHRYNLYDN